MTPGRRALLSRSSPDGYIVAKNAAERRLADKLVEEGYLRHHRGLVYEITTRGLPHAA